MRDQKLQPQLRAFWGLVARQHGVISREQLLALGFSQHAIKYRIAHGRLHPVWRGVYAVGRPELTRHGRWMAAVLACGSRAVLSHESAAALWEIRRPRPGEIEVSVALAVFRRRRGICVHRRSDLLDSHMDRRHGIPVTNPALTLVDLAARLERDQLEAAINEADKRSLTDPERLRTTVDDLPALPGIRALRDTLDRRTFTLTDSELERLFLPIARRAGLPLPHTQVMLNGYRVDFYWSQLGLVVETDGLSYHRTPAQQAKDRLRDQAHMAAGLTPLRFTRAQVRFDPQHVEVTLAAVAARLEEARRTR